MANEAQCIETPTRFARYTVSDGGAIALGTILKLSDPNTAAASSANTDIFAGIAWEEKTASDGIVELTAALDGVWDITNSTETAIVAGCLVSISGANLIKLAASTEMLSGAILGKALETASASEVIRVRVGEAI